MVISFDYFELIISCSAWNKNLCGYKCINIGILNSHNKFIKYIESLLEDLWKMKSNIYFIGQILLILLPIIVASIADELPAVDDNPKNWTNAVSHETVIIKKF